MPQTPQQETSAMLLDNHGGFSHQGRRITLHADGSYTDTLYTDVIGDEKTKIGVYTFDANGAHLILLPKSEEVEHLYRVVHNRQHYWVNAQEQERITQSGELWLRQISLRSNFE